MLPNESLPEAVDTLRAAQAAEAVGDHRQAAAAYEAFYDLATEPLMRAVRLTCVMPWARLAEHVPEVRERLLLRRDAALAAFQESHSEDSFQELSAFCDALACPDLLVDVFKAYVEQDPQGAASLYRIVDSQLIDAKEFALANRFIPDGFGEYQLAFEVFDSMRRVHAIRPDQEAQMQEHAVNFLTKNVWQTHAILMGGGRTEEAARIREAFPRDLAARGLAPRSMDDSIAYF